MKTNELLVGVLLLAYTPVFAKNYYVSTDGDDRGDGSRKHPFRTITFASTVMKPGDVCYIHAGVYRENVTINNSGTAEKPLVFKAISKKSEVIIDATEVLTGWQKVEDNIYQTTAKLAFEPIENTLFYNEELMDIARFPNNEDHDPFTLDGQSVKAGSANHFEMEKFVNADLEGAYFTYMGSHSGCSWSRKIESFENGVIKHEGVDIKKWPYKPHNPTFMTNKNRGLLFVFGAKDLLDYPGEWHYDAENKKVYAIFPDQQDPLEGKVKVQARPTTLAIEGNHVQFDHINYFGGEVHINGDYCQISNAELKQCSQSMQGLIGISAQSNTASILISGSNCTIKDNLIEGGRTSGIVMYGSGKQHLIHNNVIRYFNTTGIHANPIRTSCNEVKILNNSIYTCGRDGIYVAGKYGEVAYNDVFDCLKINNDGGVFYTVGNDDLKHTQIHHNWFHDSQGPSYTDGRVSGIYLDNNSKGYDVYRNIISNVSWGAMNINWHNTDINFYHNTIWNAGYSVERWALHYPIERIRIVNNFANVRAGKEGDEWIGTYIGKNIIDTTSPFQNEQENDFRPRRKSVLMGSGEQIQDCVHVKSKAGCEIGALRRGEKMWPVGANWAHEVMPMNFELNAKRSGIYGQDSKKRESEDDIFLTKSKK